MTFISSGYAFVVNEKENIIAHSICGDNVIWKKEAENVKRKQIVSLLLMVVMILTLMPVSVLAVDDTIINQKGMDCYGQSVVLGVKYEYRRAYN